MNSRRLPGLSTATSGQLFRFILVGLTSNLVGYLLYLFLTHFGLAPTRAMTILYGVGAAVGFFGNSRFTFAFRGGLAASGLRFLLAHLVGYCLNLMMQIVLVNKLGYPHQVVQALAVLVVAAFLFVAFQFFVFPESYRHGSEGGR